MFVILVYDMNQKRVNKALKTCRQYLEWIQNSVFEGDITGAKLEGLKSKLKKIVKDEDSVVIFEFKTKKYFKKEILGIEKSKISNII